MFFYLRWNQRAILLKILTKAWNILSQSKRYIYIVDMVLDNSFEQKASQFPCGQNVPYADKMTPSRTKRPSNEHESPLRTENEVSSIKEIP